MKPSVVMLLIVGLAGLVLISGFQCASSEFTGGKLKLSQKDYKEAKRLFEAEVKNNPGNEEAWYWIGYIDSEQGDYVHMNEAFNTALGISDKHRQDIMAIRNNQWAGHLNAGVKYLNAASPDSASYYDRALIEFTKASEAWPDTSLSYLYIGYAYNNKFDLENAAKAYRKAWEMGKDPEALKRVAGIYINQGEKFKSKFEQDNSEKLRAVRGIAGIRKNQPKNDVMSSLGAPDNIKRGPKGTRKEDWDYKRYNLTIALDNDKVVSKKFSSPYNPGIDSSSYEMAMRQYNEAIQLLREGKTALAEDTDILNILLQAYVQSNRIEEAVTEYEAVTKKNPNNKVNHYILGVLYRSASKYDAAIAEFQKAYEIDPTYSDAVFDLGATYYNWGVEILKTSDEKGEATEAHKEKFKMALPYLEKVSEEKKDDPQVWETLGTIYAQLGMQDKAIKAFDVADKIRGKK